MVTPKTFGEFTISKHLSFTNIGFSIYGVFVKLTWSSLHLVGFSWNLFSLDHSETWSIVSCKVLLSDLGIISEMLVSSADFHILKNGESEIFRSFVIAKKNQGPIFVPCGIPAGTSKKLEIAVGT